MSKPDPDETVHTSVYLPRSLLTALRQKLIGEGSSLSAWTREQAEKSLSRR